MAEKSGLENAALLRSKEIEEVIGRPPHWLVQWGITVFFVILILVFALSYFITYPETVTAPFRIVAESPSVPILLNEDGVLTKIKAKPGLAVKLNDTLFYWHRIKGNTKDDIAIVSPVGGIISYINPLVIGQSLFKEKPLFYISPLSQYYAAIYIKSSVVRKNMVGQQVTLALTQYPSSHYGYLIGAINYIGNVNTRAGYYVKINLKNGLQTNKGMMIQYMDDLSGAAEITISRKRLIDKLFDRVKF